MPDSEAPVEDQHALPAPRIQKALPAPPSSRAGGLIRKLLLVLLVLAAAGFAYWKIKSNKQETEATTAKTQAAANRAVPVTVTAVATKTMPIFINALGTVTAYNTVTVKSRVDGQLLSVNVREGQQVKQGQVLAMIDPRPYQAAVAQAEGQLAKDQASADYAKAEAGRYTALYQAGVVSKESEQTQVSSAGASAGTLDADRAAIQAAKVNVAYTRITSPINGVVGLRQVDAGNIVHASDTTGLLVVTQLQPIAVIFTMPEDQLPEVLKLIRTGHKLEADAFDRSQTTKLATGALLTVDNQIDTTTGTLKAKAVFDNKDGALFPNQFVNVRLILEQRANSLVIPASALQTGNGGNFVYVVKPGNPPDTDGKGGTGKGGTGKGGKPHSANVADSGATGNGAAGSGTDPEAEAGAPKRPPFYVDVQNVEVDLTEGTQVILKRGVNPGDKIVVDGQEKLKKYSKVDPKNGPPGGKGAGRTTANSDTGADGSTPSPDTGRGALDEPRGPKGSHGKRQGDHPSPDTTPDAGVAPQRHGKKPGSQP